MLVFDGVYLFFITITQPSSKTSVFARFRWWLLASHHHHPTTLENEHMCSFSTVVSLIISFGMTRRCPQPPCHVDNPFRRDEGVSAPPGHIEIVLYTCGGPLHEH